MNCRTLSGVKFGKRSREAIDEFRSKQQLSRILRRLIPVGTMATIFVGNDALKVSYSIYSTDFQAMAQAMASLPAIERRVLANIANLAALDTTGQESEFWRQVAYGVINGCDPSI